MTNSFYTQSRGLSSYIKLSRILCLYSLRVSAFFLLLSLSNSLELYSQETDKIFTTGAADSSSHYFYSITNTTQWTLYATELTGTLQSTKFVYDTNEAVPVEKGDIERNKIVFYDSLYYGVHQSFIGKAIHRFIGRPSNEIYEAMGYTEIPPPKLEIIPGDFIFIENLSLDPSHPEITSTNRLGIAFRVFMAPYPEETKKLLSAALNQISRMAYKGKLIVFQIPGDDISFLKNNVTINGEPFENNFEIVLWSNIDKSGDTNQVYHAAESFGYLKKITLQEFERGEYTSKDILIMDEVPFDIGPLSGFISTVSQDLLSHTIIRTRGQNIPNVRLLRTTINPYLQELEKDGGGLNQLVYFKAWGVDSVRFITQTDSRTSPYVSDVFSSEEDFLAKANAYFENRAPKLPPLTLDNTVSDIFQWNARTDTPRADRYGVKGRNFAFLDRKLREAGRNRDEYKNSFLIPFYYYDSFLSQDLNPEICAKAKNDCKLQFPDDTSGGCDHSFNKCSQEKTIKSLISGLINKESGNYSSLMGSPMLRKTTLSFIREAIKAGQFSDSAKSALKDKLSEAFGQTTRIRFRSSTNAEDLPGLSGAGLYSSHGGCLADSDGNQNIALPRWEDAFFSLRGCSLEKYNNLIEQVVKLNLESLKIKTLSDGTYEFKKASKCTTEHELKRNFALACRIFNGQEDTRNKDLALELLDDLAKDRPVLKAIRKVFASVWYEKAFLNRDYFGIDHEKVNMAILVHPSYADELANGVLVVSDLPSGVTKIQVSAQVEDISITNPFLPGVKSDSFYINKNADGTYSKASYQSTSTELLAGNSPVLNDSQIKELAEQAILIHEGLRTMPGSHNFTGQTDIEWKLMPSLAGPIIVLKQARPY